MDIITGALNEGYGVDVVYLDFIKTFGRVPHKRLIMKLGAVGISGNLLCWCSSFLSNRFQRVVEGNVVGASPEWRSSRIGPRSITFYNFINDLITSIQIPIKVYADDTKLIFPYNNHIQCVALQNALDIISDWTSIWLLHLNIEKCKVLHMGPKRFLLNKLYILTICKYNRFIC